VDSVTDTELLARTFVDLADTLVSDFDLVDFLHVLANRCVPLLDGAAAGVMLADQRHGLRVVAASDERIRLLELFELQNAEGPCVDAFQTGKPIQASLADADDRWPTFTPEARNSGFGSVCALVMRLRSERVGALNLFRADDRPLSDIELATAQALADVATIGLVQERELRHARLLAEQLQYALDSRVMIEQAKGIIAERVRVDMDRAFELLRSFARNHNRHLTDVARAVISREVDTSTLLGTIE
jgi:hypothetical protein